MNGITALIKDPTGLPNHSFRPCEDPGKGLSPECNHVGILILAFSESRTIRNKFLLFVSYAVCGILLQHPEQGKTVVNLEFKNEKGDITTNLTEIKKHIREY